MNFKKETENFSEKTRRREFSGHRYLFFFKISYRYWTTYQKFSQLFNRFYFLIEGHGLEPDSWSTTLNINGKTEANSAISQTADWKWELALSHVSLSKVRQQLYSHVRNIDRGVVVDFNGSCRGTINARNGHVLRPKKCPFYTDKR